MSRFLIPTGGPSAWQALLADPERHWRTGYSARSLAYCWEDADGFPTSVRSVLAQSDTPTLREAELLLGIPEHEVPLPGGERPSQNDVWVLARGAGELISIAVEGKVAESFGPTVGEWRQEASPGKRKRLAFLEQCLGLSAPVEGDVRYQLLHRTASAVIEARRFGAAHAVLLVHSFSATHEWLSDYQRFLSLFEASGDVDSITSCNVVDSIQLHAAWVHGEDRYLSS